MRRARRRGSGRRAVCALTVAEASWHGRSLDAGRREVGGVASRLAVFSVRRLREASVPMRCGSRLRPPPREAKVEGLVTVRLRFSNLHERSFPSNCNVLPCCRARRRAARSARPAHAGARNVRSADVCEIVRASLFRRSPSMIADEDGQVNPENTKTPATTKLPAFVRKVRLRWWRDRFYMKRLPLPQAWPTFSPMA